MLIAPACHTGFAMMGSRDCTAMALPASQMRKIRSYYMMANAEDERRERLRLLFGEDSARIAEKTAPKRQKAADVDDIKMLIEGMQELEFGSIRLVDVNMAPGPLEASFEPLLPSSTLLCVRLEMPLGMILEEAESGTAAGAPFVAELLDDSNAGKGGVEVGDVIRASTAVTMGMSYPAWQLIMGGVGRPQLQKVLMPTKGEPFEKVMAAVTSNSAQMQGNGQIVLILERSSNVAPTPAAQEVSSVDSDND